MVIFISLLIFQDENDVGVHFLLMFRNIVKLLQVLNFISNSNGKTAVVTMTLNKTILPTDS